jgi:CheY-like chemotaxis protein
MINSREKNILLIDDDPEEAEIFKEALGSVSGSTVFHYLSNCKDAVNQLKHQLLPMPDLIFLDINMPLMNGLDCLQEIKKNQALSHIPVVMYTNSTRQDEIVRAKRFGAHDFWTKPTTYKDLIRKLKEFVNAILFGNA